MVLRKSSTFFCKFSTQASSLEWRKQIKRRQIVSEVSSALLQRRDWVPIIQKLNLSLKLTQDTFLQILHKTQENPETALSFFNWARTSLRFEPEFKSHCRIISIFVNAGLLQPATSLLDSVIQSEPSFSVIDSIVGACQDKDSQSVVSNFVLEFYSNKGLLFEGLEIFRKIRVYGLNPPSVNCCNALLGALQQKNEIKLGWCFFAASVRYGVSMNSFTWSLAVRLLCKEGKLENAIKLVNSGVHNTLIYNLIIDACCKNGNFKAATDLLNDMHCKDLTPGFSTYSSILDGACRYADVEVIETTMRDMVAKKLLPASPLLGYDSIIQKLCELGKIYAAKMFFVRARSAKIGLRDASYGCMLRVLCKEGRGKEAMEVYGLIREECVAVESDCYSAFAEVICKEEPSKEVEAMLKDFIDRGFVPCGSDLSKFVAAQCRQGRWREAEDILILVLDKGLMLDSFCCSLLVEYYCACKRIDLGIALHDKMEKLGGNLDVTTYNFLLVGLFKERKIEEASRVFDFMRRKKVLNTGSYSIMITGLSCVDEMRRAMKIHDEMLKLGLKPDKDTYKHLISRFL